MKLSVVVIHGLSSADKHFSVELKHRIVEEYMQDTDNERMDDDLIFHEIYWGDLLKESTGDLIDKANYRNDLTYLNMRQLFVDYLATPLVYNSKSSNSLYQKLHNRLEENFKRITTHRRVDAQETPVVILAHSFGSVLVANYIAEIQNKQKLAGGDLEAYTPLEQFNTLAGFITFGSPLAIYSTQPKDFPLPSSIVGKNLPSKIQERVKWLNYYDKDDVIAYPLKNINETYKALVHDDFEINVGSAATSWNPACHNGYWEDKDFYKPVAEYLAEIRAETTFWK